VRAATISGALGGFVLGAVLAILVPPLALALALVLVGLLVWARVTGQDAGALTPPAAGYLLAALVYVVLAVLYAVG
jgi:hypothetical protein